MYDLYMPCNDNYSIDYFNSMTISTYCNYCIYNLIRCVESVSDGVLCHFKEAAEKLIEEKGPENALCAALAYITGFTELTARSLLTSEKVIKDFIRSFSLCNLCLN